MENTTSRLAIAIQNLPSYEIDWEDRSPQKNRSSLIESDILASDDDGIQLHDRMVKFVQSFLVKKLKSLSDLVQFAPPPSQSTPAHKSDVVPLQLLFEDEKSIDSNIQILNQFAKDANLDGNPQVCLEHYTK